MTRPRRNKWLAGSLFLALVAGCGSAFNGEEDTTTITGRIAGIEGSPEESPSLFRALTSPPRPTPTDISPSPASPRGNRRFPWWTSRGEWRLMVWRWSYGMAFPTVMSAVTLQPGESRIYEATWDQRDFFGQPVGPGEYALVGAIMALPTPGQPDIHPLRSRPFPFTIEAPPAPLE